MIQTKSRGFIFNEARISAPQKNGFDVSHERKTTARLGILYGADVIETLPSDDFEISQEMLIRVDATIAPFMHRLNVYTHWFYCPLRILWNGFEEMISRGNGKVKMVDSASYTPPIPPTISFAKLVELSTTFYDNGTELVKLTPRIANNFGIPYTTAEKAADIDICIIPFIAYAVCYNEFYRDTNLIDEIEVDLLKDLNGNIDSIIDQDLTIKNALIRCLKTQYRAWEKDYFTSALPEPQRGPDVLLPIGQVEAELPITSAMPMQTNKASQMTFKNKVVSATGTYYVDQTASHTPKLINNSNGYFDGVNSVYTLTTDFNGNVYGNQTSLVRSQNSDTDVNNTTTAKFAVQDISSPLSAKGELDLSGTGITVQKIREAFSLAKWFEKAARVGSRYVETIKGFFNSDVPDSRLQSPEYITGYRQPFVVSEVLQTSESNETPQGNQAGHTISVDNTGPFRYHCPEHGFLIALQSILPRTSYSNGIPKMFFRSDFTDWPWPEFENIGEQPVLNKEIYSAPTFNEDGVKPTNPDGVFGYQSRYAEYKYIPDFTGGDFTINQKHWTLDRQFNEQPELSEDFVSCHASDRVFPVETSESEVIKRGDDLVGQDQFKIDMYVTAKVVRPLQMYSEPNL